MARYTGPKARINRRLRQMLYEASGTARATDRRESPPGMHTRPARPSGYGAALNEKQKIKHYYGLGERQLRRVFSKASKMKGNTGEQLLVLCERRIDNVIRRAGFTKTRPQARQGVAHGHFQVNGVKCNSPSYVLRPGDVVTVRNRENLRNYYKSLQGTASGEPIDWVTVDAETLTITMQGLPSRADVSLPVDGNVVTEFMQR